MSNTKEYNNGKPIDVTTISDEEKSLAISEWSEGNECLRKAIEACIKNNINTHASCKGHSITDRPYISMIATEENAGKIINIMNRICQMNHVVISLAFSDYNRFNGKRKTLLNIYGNVLNRNNVFNAVAESANKEIKYEDLSEDAKALWDFHIAMRKHGMGIDHNVILTKGITGKIIDVDNAFNHLTLNDILEKNKFKLAKGLNIQYFKRGNPIKIVYPVIESIDDVLRDYPDTELDSVYSSTERNKEFLGELKVENDKNQNVAQNKINSVEKQITKPTEPSQDFYDK